MISYIDFITSPINTDALNTKIKAVKTKGLFYLFILGSFLLSVTFVSAQPTITSFSPTSDTVGATVTITGSNFNTTPANNIVFFGATRATVSVATATSLTVTVPIGATFSPITVLNTASGLAAYSSQFFNPTFSPNKGSFTSTDLPVKVDFTTGLNPVSVAIGDIDGDGKPDLAIANRSSNTVSVLRNTSSNDTVRFATRIDFTTGSAPASIALGDIDGDGKPDLAIANRSSNTVSVLRNTGSSGTVSFATKVDFTTGTNPISVVIGNLNGDGKPDLTIANLSSYTVSLFRNTGTLGTVSFATKVDFSTGANPTSVAINDIDGDGKSDLAIANDASNTVSVMRNTSSSTTISFATKVDFVTGSSPQSVTIGDIDRDGKPDLAIANYGSSSNTVSVFRNTGSSGIINFATKVDFATGSSPKSVVIGDMDGDGKPDLAIANSFSNNVSVLRNTSSIGTFSFATKVDFPTGTNPYSIVIGDIDGDGKPDLAITNNNGNNVSILPNDPYLPQPTITSFNPTSGAVGDSLFITGTNFNIVPSNNIVFLGATRATVSVATATSLTVTVPIGASFSTITVLNIASGLAAYSSQLFNPTFSPNKGSITTADLEAKIDFTVGTRPQSVVISDIDGDGKPDLAIANRNSNTVSVLRNTSSSGTVSYATKVDFATGSSPQSVTIGDIDGDGKPDLIIANNTGNSVSVLRNTGVSGTVNFAAKVDYPTLSNPYSVAIGDLDRDGKPDLAIANNNSGQYFCVLRNTGSFGMVNFATKIDFAAGFIPQSIAIGDLDGDGKLDLAIANYSSGTVSLLRNTGTVGVLSFAVGINYPTGTSPSSVAIGDLDSDGKPDLTIANQIDNTVSVLRNTGSIGTVTFATKVDFTIGTNPNSVAIGDLDGDNKPDLITANINSNTVSVLRNTSSSAISFATKVDFATGSSPKSVVIGDIDGDGKPDLAIANSATSSTYISILRNNPQLPTITITGLLMPFSSCTGKASVEQNFTVSGIILSSNLVITPPTGFEVSTTSCSGFGDSISLTPTSGIINTTSIFIRLKSSAIGSLSGNVVCTSNGTPTKNIAASGLVNVLTITASTSNIGICPSALPYTWNGRTYSANTTDTIYLANTLGCDSVTILKLTVKSTSSSTNNISICPSELPYSWNNRTYNAAITDTIYLTNSVGCDSVTILKLIVKSASSSTNNISICSGELPYSWNSRTYNAAITDTIYLTNSVGCDSITILKLFVKTTSSSTNNLIICPSALPYTWNGLTFTGTGSQTKTGLINSVGCDSSATLNLTVKPTSSSTNNLSICPSALPFTWNGLTFTGAGSQTKTGLANSLGCDSSATLNLIVNPTPITSNIIGLANVARLDTASYSVTSTNGSVYNWVVTKGTIQSGVGANAIRVKWNVAGTDTLKVIETSNQGCVGIQKTFSVNIGPATGINAIKTSNNITIYPNPFNETIHITLLNNLVLEKAILYDLLGKETITTYKNEIDVRDLKSGIYLIQVLDNNGNMYNQKLIKN